MSCGLTWLTLANKTSTLQLFPIQSPSLTLGQCASVLRTFIVDTDGDRTCDNAAIHNMLRICSRLNDDASFFHFLSYIRPDHTHSFYY